MHFKEDFFRDEYRDGFLVDSRMKRFWAASIETLEEIDKVCKKHGITWYADWGTLLGTVRHQGFIPWDDDIDIAMKRSDYEKFLKVASKDLPEHYIVFDSESEKFWVENAASVTNWDRESIMIEKERLIKYHGCPFYIGIDVFPLDYMCVDEKTENLRQRMLMEIWYAIAAIDMGAEDDQIRQRVATLETILQTKIGEWNGDYVVLKRELRKLADVVMQIFTDSQAEELTELRWLLVGEYTDAHFKKEWYDEVIYMPFEGFQMPVPVGYDEVLKHTYGDYMTPVRGTASHDYPKFKKQLKLIDEWKQEVKEERDIDEIVAEILRDK